MVFRLEVIDYFDPTGQNVVARAPSQGSAAIQFGAQLIVQQSQEAIFFRDGRAMDSFSAGRYTLTTANIPLISRILTSPWEKSPFQAAVIFVGKQTFIDQRWGTRQPITLRDPDFGLVRLRGFGKFAFRVVDGPLLVNGLVGTQNRFTTEEITSYLKDVIVSSLTDLLATSGIGMLDLPAKFDEIGAATRVKVASAFAKFGLELTDFLINNISPPEEVQKAIDARSSMGAIGDLRSYTLYQAANGMAGIGQNPGNSAAGLGMGAGIGMMIPGMLQQALAGAPASAAPASSTIGHGAQLAPTAPSAPNAGGNLSFGDLKRSGGESVPTDVKGLVRQIAKNAGWKLTESDSVWDVELAIGSLRKQVVHLEFDKPDFDGHPTISFWSVCGHADPSNAMALLRYNNQLIHGAFAIRTTSAGDQVVLRANQLADTADPLEITRTVTSIAWQADQVEEQLAGHDQL